MNDSRLNELLKMALEAEALEADVARPAQSGLRLVGTSPEERAALLHTMDRQRIDPSQLRWSRGWRWKSGLALAACAMLAWGFSMYSSALRTAPPLQSKQPESLASNLKPLPADREGSGSPRRFLPLHPRFGAAAETRVSLKDAGSRPEECVVLAIYQSSHGDCHCVQVQPHAFADGRRLLEHNSEDLSNIRLKPSCGPGSDQLILIALEGPPESLPSSAAQAETLAACLADAPKVCDGSANCYERVAQSCLPPGVTVLAQTLTPNPR